MKKKLLSLFSHRTLALLRWDLYFIKENFKNALFNKKSGLKKRVNIKSEYKYLNLGSGPRGIDNNSWINIDGYIDKNVHYLCDFNKALPFEDETFDGIFCEHVVEHFDFEHGVKMMAECRRILKKDGVIRIIVPDGEIIINSYINNPRKIVDYKHCESGKPMEAVNKWFYQRYEHQCIYDSDYMNYMVKQAGFSESRKGSFKQSPFGKNELLIDDIKYEFESLYQEAQK